MSLKNKSDNSKIIKTTKVRTKLYEDKNRLRKFIENENSDFIQPLSAASSEDFVENTYGVDGSITKIDDRTGEENLRVASAAGVHGIFSNRDPVKILETNTFKSFGEKEDYLFMRVLEMRAQYQITEMSTGNDLIQFDGAIHQFMDDCSNLFNKNNFHILEEQINPKEFKQLIENIKTLNIMYFVKDWDSKDVRKHTSDFNPELNGLSAKRIADVVLLNEESIVEKIHPLKKLRKYSYLESSNKYISEYINPYNDFVKYASEHYTSEILKFGSNDTPIKVEYMKDENFTSKRNKIINSLRIEMTGSQKESLSIYFADLEAKKTAINQISINEIEKNMGLEKKDFLPNYPFNIRTL